MDETRELMYNNGYHMSIVDLYDILEDMHEEITLGQQLEITDRLRHCLEVRRATGFRLDKESADGKV